MKKPILFLLLILLSFTFINAQLTWLNPKPSGYTNTHISFINPSTGYMMNTYGELFVSRDTGNTWQKVRRFQNSQTMRLANGTGIIPTFDGLIYLSKDNGTTWVKQNNGSGSYTDWADIVSRDTLFLLKNTTSSYSKALFRSMDRGLTWTQMNSDLSQYNLKTLDFVSGQVGYGSRPDGIFKTTNGGATWTNIFANSSSAQFTAIKFRDSLNGFAYREMYGMMKTTDGGITWTINSNWEDINDIYIISATHAFAVGEYGHISRTTDGGNTWTNITPTSYMYAYDLNSCYFFNETAGIATGLRGRVIKTNDAGASWRMIAPTYTDISTLAWPDAQNGYATSWNKVYKTTDGGINWSELPLNITLSSYDNSRFEESYFWHRDSGIVAVAAYTRIFRTTDGGQNWTISNPSTIGSFDNCTGMSFPTKDTGYISLYASGGSTAIFKTSDRGNSWQLVNQYGGYKKIQFLDTRNGFSIFNNNVHRTRDGGVTWTALAAPSNSGITAMWFLNPAKGFIAGDQGFMKMTADSGNTWVNVELPTIPSNYQDIVSLRFYDNNIGYYTNDEGFMYKTINGGITWKWFGNASFHTINDISFRPDSVAIFGGIYGTILSTDFKSCQINPPSSFACGRMLATTVDVSLSSADSIYFEYGKDDFTNRIAATPFSVNNDKQDVTAYPTDLVADSVYKVRVRVLHRGVYKYSDVLYYIPNHPPTPVITAAGNILTSSATTGNLWYLNNSLIASATGQQYTATASGTYTVLQNLNNCYSYLSPGYTLTITAVDQLNQLTRDIRIFPNPVNEGQLTVIVNGRQQVNMLLTDLNGRRMQTGKLLAGNNTLSLIGYSSGLYLLQVTDPVNKLTYTYKISKF